MKSIRTVGLFVTLALVLGAWSASSASAVEWVKFKCVEVAPGTGKYKDAKCHEKGAGNWERAEEKGLTEGLSSESSGVVAVEDTGAGGAAIECSIVETGLVGPHAADTTSSISATSCKTVKGTCGAPTLSAMNLPWNTELYEIEGKIRDKIKTSGAGLPGWRMSCFGIIKDTCEGETSVAMTESESGLDISFDASSERLNCSVGGAKTGVLTGLTILNKIEGLEL